MLDCEHPNECLRKSPRKRGFTFLVLWISLSAILCNVVPLHGRRLHSLKTLVLELAPVGHVWAEHYLFMEPKVNVPLSALTTFRAGGPARYFFDLSRAEELSLALSFAKQRDLPFFLLGGGSNTLFSDQGFEGVVARFSGGTILFEKEGNNVLVYAPAGVVWDELVKQAVSAGLYGIESLSYIPGSVGAAPVQNIGAYGTELSDVVESVDVYDLDRDRFLKFSNEECGFGYRNSFFKSPEGKRFLVTGVTLRLSSQGVPNLSYKDVSDHFLRTTPQKTPSLSEVRDAVIAIRKAKLPDVKDVGTAGSFFKNPIIEEAHFEKLKNDFPGMPGVSFGVGRVKVPAGWLLDSVGNFKGFSRGSVGVWEKQALVIVNRGGATAFEIISLAREMAETIWKKTNIALESEVVIV